MLRYQLEGNGSPLLLIHGWGVTYPIWQNLIPLLRSQFQLVMIELPGIGGSPDVGPRKPYYQACAEAIEEVRLTLGIERWAILAYSAGTRAAEAYLQQYPEHVTRAAFLCPVYLKGICSLGVRLLGTTHNSRAFISWLLSDWRLYSLVVALGFNGRRHDYSSLWKDEIELQSLDTLVRSLCELPGRGRAPFQLPAIPTLFIWGNRDALAARPAHPRPYDIVIPANHSAPMLAAPSVAAAVIPFLTTGMLVSSLPRKEKRLLLRWRSTSKLEKTKAQHRTRPLALVKRAARKRSSTLT